MAGKGVMEADATLTSVLPAWRKTVFHYVTSGPTGGVRNAKKWKESALEASKRIQPLRDITPNSGAYWNEADYYEPDWEQSFFGDNYDRLKQVKEEYDPDGIFRVWNGVGGTRPEGNVVDDVAASLLIPIAALVSSIIVFLL